MVIIGISGAEYETRDYVTAYNSSDGTMKWRWFTIPAPGEKGSDSWPAGSDIWKHGGGSMWMTPAIDPDLGLLYITVGNPGPDLDGTVRKGDNLYTESIVALHVNDGTYAWHFQEVHHDIWDYDTVSPVILFDGTVNGKQAKAVAEAGKTGWVYILDRATGQPLIPAPDKSVKQGARQNTAATQPFPQGDSFVPQHPTDVDPSEKYPQGGIFTPFEEEPVLAAPGANGGSEWSPMSFSPQTGYVYVSGIVQPQIFTFNPSEIQQGNLKLGSGFVSPPNQNTSGTFTAIDTRTNKIAWQNKSPYMMIGGSTVTAGGLVLVGEGDGVFKAINAKTGEIVWRFQTGAGVNAAATVYEAGGDEFVAVASGGNFQLNYPRGDTLRVFSLKGTMGQATAPQKPSTRSLPQTLGPAVATNTATIVNFAFGPDNITVKAGTTVTWTNKGAFPHSATSDQKVWDTQILQTGQAASFTFDKPGTYMYFCKPHPFMLGQVTVTP
jgi:alcohol dehydrogenase (cytochrome c)